MSSSDSPPGATFVVELTPPGRAAVAVVLVTGCDAERVVDGCFTPASGRPLADLPIGRIALGRWDGPSGEDLIVCRRSQQQIEIHCHGGLAAVNAVIGRLVERGCRRASWQEWLGRSSGDPIRAAAHIGLAQATTARTAAILLDQYHGALSSAIRTAAAAVSSANWNEAADVLDAVLAYRDVGVHLTGPWRVVLTGRTNVGKSSLINALAGYQRSIVSQEPGTTRDVVTTQTAIDGWPVELSDTAGLRAAEDELESAGMALATASIANADLIVVVHDATNPDGAGHELEPAISESISQVQPPPRVIHVLNKIELRPAERDSRAAGSIPTSAVTGAGIPDLVAAIGRSLVPSPPPPGTAVTFTSQQLRALSSARAAIDARVAAAVLAGLQPLLPAPR